MTNDELFALGLAVVFGGFAFGLVVAFIASMFLGLIEWARRILGF